MFEFVACIEKRERINALSVAYGAIPFGNLKIGETYQVNLMGGSPNNNLNIDPNDIRIGGGFFRSFNKSKIKPILHLTITK